MKTYKLRKPKRRERVFVSKNDIKIGKPVISDQCPVAIALERRFEGLIDVGPKSVEIDGIEYRLCEKGQRFILDFDKKSPTESFHLYITRISI